MNKKLAVILNGLIFLCFAPHGFLLWQVFFHVRYGILKNIEIKMIRNVFLKSLASFPRVSSYFCGIVALLFLLYIFLPQNENTAGQSIQFQLNKIKQKFGVVFGAFLSLLPFHSVSGEAEGTGLGEMPSDPFVESTGKTSNAGTPKKKQRIIYPPWVMTLKLITAACILIHVVGIRVINYFSLSDDLILFINYYYDISDLRFLLVLVLVELILMQGDLPFRKTFFAVVPVLLYGGFSFGYMMKNSALVQDKYNYWYYLWRQMCGSDGGVEIAVLRFFGINMLVCWGTACALWIIKRLFFTKRKK